MLINLEQEQIEYIGKFIEEHRELISEDIQDRWKNGYSVIREVKELKLVKSILNEFKN